MSMLKEAFEAGKFGVTAEMAPPKGYDFSEQLEAAKLLNGKVHGVNVTDMQSASLKASSLGLCVALKNAGIEPILQNAGMLPEHLIDHVVPIQVQRGDRDPVFWFGPAQGVRRQQHHIPHPDRSLPELAEE